MRICLYTPTALPKLGGIEMLVDALAREFLASGHEVSVLAPNPRRPLRPTDAALPYYVMRHPRPISTRFGVSWYRHWLLKLHAQRKFDVLHCHGIDPPGYLAALCRDRLQVPIVITSHGGDMVEGSARLSKPQARRRAVQALAVADVLIATSRFTAEGYLRLQPQAKRVISIPNGVHLSQFSAAVSQPVELNAIEAKKYFLYLGRINRQKGVELLLRAFAGLRTPSEFGLVVAGDGPMRTECEQLCRELGIANRVVFPGPVRGEAKTWLLQNGIATIMPSRGPEGFGLVALESYASGTPVLASRVPGLEDIVSEDQTGLLFEPDSTTSLTAALGAILSDRARTSAWGQCALQTAQGYSWHQVADQHIRLYGQLMSERAAA